MARPRQLKLPMELPEPGPYFEWTKTDMVWALKYGDRFSAVVFPSTRNFNFYDKDGWTVRLEDHFLQKNVETWQQGITVHEAKGLIEKHITGALKSTW